MTWTIGPGWITTYDPFGSVSFNGSSQYLTTPANAALAPVTNFTVEAWIYANTLTSTNSSGVGIVFIGNSTSNNGRLQFLVGTDGTLTLYLRNNSAVDVTTVTSSAGSILIDTWYHVAGVRNGNNYTLYVNGNPVGTTTSATAMTYAANILNIGFMRQSNLLHYWNGYISNFRLTNGVAVYTGAFNVPRAPLQGIQPAGTTNIAAITGTQTSLLLNTPNNASFIADSSANNFTLTNNGGAVAAALTPFVNGGGAGWKFAGPENGSASFNGTSQYLTAPANAAFAFGTGDFTVEAWVNTSVAFTGSILPIAQSDVVGTSTNNKWWIGFYGTGLFFGTHSTGGFSVVTTTAFSTATWYHVAVTRASGVMKMFINGGSTAFTTTGTPSGYNLSQNGLTTGAISTPYYWNGYISNLRVVKGLAVYTSSFTPPIRQLPAVQDANVYGVPSAAITGTQTSLLLNTPNNSQNTLDTSTNNFAITNTGSTPPSGINPFVPDLGAVSFNGSTQYLTTASAIIPASTNFTVECWVYPTSFAAIDEIFSQRDTGGSVGRIDCHIATTGLPTLFIGSSPSTTTIVSAVACSLNTWAHIAVTRSDNNYVLYLNGVSVATGSATTAILQTGFMIGALNSSPRSRYFPGYISNFRVVSGVVVYTTTFTPSTQPLPATQSANVYGNPSAAITGTQTSLLLNTPNNANFIKDSSTNGFTVTNNGAALATSLTPFSS